MSLRHITVLILTITLTGSAPCFAESTLESVHSSGVLLWGADAEGGAPFVFPDPQNPEQRIGFEVDLANAIAKQLGVTASLVQTDWTSLLPALQRGDFHIAMNGIEWTPERAQAAALTRPYYLFQQQLVVRRDDNEIHKLSDVRGRSVGTLASSLAHTLLDRMPGVTVKTYAGQVEPYRDLKLGRLDAVFMDHPIAQFYAGPDPELKFAGPPVGEGYYVIAAPPGDAEFVHRLDEILGTLNRDGTLKSIYEKWGMWNTAQWQLGRVDPSKTYVYDIKKENEMEAYLILLLKGAGMTVAISILSMVLAVLLGMGLTMMRWLGGSVLNAIAVGYIEVFRGTPLLLQLYILYYGLPNMGIRLDAFTAAVVGLGMNYAAYEAEVYRAGLLAVPRSQVEGGAALGMGPFMLFRFILVPQSIRMVLPPMTNDFIALFKDTSLVSIIAIVELTKSYNMLAVSSMKFLELGLLTAALYMMMSIPLSVFSARLHRRSQPMAA